MVLLARKSKHLGFETAFSRRLEEYISVGYFEDDLIIHDRVSAGGFVITLRRMFLRHIALNSLVNRMM